MLREMTQGSLVRRRRQAADWWTRRGSSRLIGETPPSYCRLTRGWQPILSTQPMSRRRQKYCARARVPVVPVPQRDAGTSNVQHSTERPRIHPVTSGPGPSSRWGPLPGVSSAIYPTVGANIFSRQTGVIRSIIARRNSNVSSSDHNLNGLWLFAGSWIIGSLY